MNCVLFAKMDQVFSLKKQQNIENLLAKWKTILDRFEIGLTIILCGEYDVWGNMMHGDSF